MFNQTLQLNIEIMSFLPPNALGYLTISRMRYTSLPSSSIRFKFGIPTLNQEQGLYYRIGTL